MRPSHINQTPAVLCPEKHYADSTDSTENTNIVMSAIVDSAGGAASTAPALEINPSDWSYLAEGGFHIILRYDGTSPELSGKILRIGKKSLGHPHEQGGGAKGEAAAAAEVAAAASPVAPDEAGARRKFERGVLIPLLGAQYVQPGDAVTLSMEDIDKIHYRCPAAAQQCAREKGRQTNAEDQ